MPPDSRLGKSSNAWFTYHGIRGILTAVQSTQWQQHWLLLQDCKQLCESAPCLPIQFNTSDFSCKKYCNIIYDTASRKSDFSTWINNESLILRRELYYQKWKERISGGHCLETQNWSSIPRNSELFFHCNREGQERSSTKQRMTDVGT